MTLRILTVDIAREHDVVAARQRARQIGAMLDFGAQDQTRIATAVSELARNAHDYAGRGKVEFSLEESSVPQVLVIDIIDAAGVIGLNRGAHGHAAGFRTTTLLVGLAASVAMIQANILLSTGGKTAQAFGVLDLMRLPLGILTGVGLIGGGSILKRGDLVTGVTTAATL